MTVNADLARSLYLGWLMAVQTDCLEEDALEPEVPPNLGQLTAAQLYFVDFFGIDQDLLAAAAMNSPLIHSEPREHEELSAWIKSLPTGEKDLFLSRVVSEDAGKVALELQSRFFRQRKSQYSGATPKRRATTELLAAADDLREARKEKQRKKTAQERERKEREAAKAREKHLASLEGKSEELWDNVDELVATRLPKNYALTIALLIDLRDLARRENHPQEFYNRLQEFRTQHSSKSALMRRIAEAGL